MKNGVWVSGPQPRNQVGRGPKVITHRAQRAVVASSGSRLDALLTGEARICIKRSLGGLGDIIMATPIAKGAKRKFPHCHVTYAVPTNYADGDLVELLLHIPYIDEIVDYTLIDRDDYDSFTDITRTGLSVERPGKPFANRIDLFAEAAGIPLYGEPYPLYVMLEEEREWGKQFVERAIGPRGARGTIGIHIRSNDPKRTWPAYRIREFVKLAKEKGYHVFLFGWKDSPDEWRLAGSTQVFDYKIRQAAAVLEHCDVLVCPDSVMLHLAGAMNKKTVALFGSMPPSCRINHYHNAIAVVNQQLGCIGCVYSSCSNSYYCMSSLLAEAVMAAVEQKLSSEKIVPEVAPVDGRFVIDGGTRRSVTTFRI